MVADRAKRANEIFRRALDADPEQRTSLVQGACAGDAALRADVDRLLVALTRSTGFLEDPALSRSASARTGTIASAGPSKPPDEIPGYRIIRVLGAGGMATVFEAQQLAPRRRVALKVLHPGLAHTSAGQRLRFEADILARLKHRGIAQIYEVGDASGAPFIAMEYVEEAHPITEHARRAGLSLHDCLAMFADVCDAVQHGHQLGIIHRDLKPANIVVGADARPKVIDFGIARSALPESERITLAAERGQVIGTLSTMSPEQCSGEGSIDTRCDVYSLGVVLYELVTGRVPIDVSGKPLLEAIRAIQREKPAAPASLVARLPAELDAVILKALEKDPRDRYPTASELAADIRRFLENRPVLARPATTIEQVRKFARRHRALVGTAAAFVLLLATAAAVTGRMAYVARAALADARERTDELEDVIAFQQSQIRGTNVPAMGDQIREAILRSRSDADRETVEQALRGVNFTTVALSALDQSILERTREAIDTQFAERPIVRARLLFTLAATMNTLGLKAKAQGPLEGALELRRAEFGDDHEDTLQCVSALGELCGSLGRLDEALTHATAAYEGRARLLGPEHRAALTSASTLAGVHRVRGEYAEARRLWVDTLAARRRTLGDDDPDTLISLNNAGVIYAIMNDLDAAEAAWRELLQRRKRIYGPESAEYRASLSNLGLLMHERGKLDEARPLLEEALASLRRNLSDTHASTLETMASVADLYVDLGDLDAADALLTECLEARRRTLGPTHQATLRSSIEYAELLHRRGDHSRAIELGIETVQIQRRTLGDSHPDAVAGAAAIAAITFDAGNAEQAEGLAREALNRAGSPGSTNARVHAELLLTSGRALTDLHRRDEAAAALISAHELLKNQPRPGDPLARSVTLALADLYDAWHADAPERGFDAKAREWRAAADK